MKRYLALILFVLLLLVSCSDKEPVDKDTENEVFDQIEEIEDVEESIPEDETVETPPVTSEIDNTPSISPLTGLPVDAEHKNSRPVAVVLNNLKDSLPQVGIGAADVVWECNMEGGITRLVALYSDISKVEELGSIRSARNYFIDVASIHGAILAHAGGSPSFYSDDKSFGYDNIDGVNMYTIPSGTFWRDQEKRASRGLEHCMETSGEKLIAAFASQKYKTETDEQKTPFEFYSEPTVPEGAPANTVTIKHSTYISPKFTYNAETNKYYKESYGRPHIEESTEEQIAFENVLILFAPHRIVDEALRLNINLVGEGKGILVTAGQSVDIVWKRSSRSDTLTLETEDGSVAKLNTGKTHITLFDSSAKNSIVIQ